jgi:hypothetical protein
MSSRGSSRRRTLAALVCAFALCGGTVHAAHAAFLGGRPELAPTAEGSWLDGVSHDFKFWLAAQVGRLSNLAVPASFWPGAGAQARRARPEGTSMGDPNGIGTTGGGNGGPIIVLPPHP